jgi:hypothetical protein
MAKRGAGRKGTRGIEPKVLTIVQEVDAEQARKELQKLKRQLRYYKVVIIEQSSLQKRSRAKGENADELTVTVTYGILSKPTGARFG